MISKEFARCLAKISGDGNLRPRHVRYNNTCAVLLQEFKEDMVKEFGELHFTEGKVNTGTPFVVASRVWIVKRFLEQLPDFRSSAIYIPDSVKEADEDVQAAYLRSFYDDEGCAALRLYEKGNEWKRNITLTSNSFRILEDVKCLLLISFGIKTNSIIRNGKGDAYVLSITGKGNIAKFKERIGFLHPLKVRRLDLMVESYQATSKNKELFDDIKKRLEEVNKK